VETLQKVGVCAPPRPFLKRGGKEKKRKERNNLWWPCGPEGAYRRKKKGERTAVEKAKPRSEAFRSGAAAIVREKKKKRKKEKGKKGSTRATSVQAEKISNFHSSISRGKEQRERKERRPT